jgi:hypothetical protein
MLPKYMIWYQNVIVFMPYGGIRKIDEYTGNAKNAFFENSRTWVTWKD